MIQWKTFGITVCILGMALALVYKIDSRGVPVVLRTSLENLPMQLGKYHGQEDSFPQGVYDELKADLHVYRHYRAGEGDQIDLYIGYYGTAKGGRTGHNPYGCLPAAGWGIVENSTLVMKPSYKANGVHVNLVVARKGSTNNIMLHWYQMAGTEVLASGFQQNLQRYKGRLLYNRNDGAYMQIASFVEDQDVLRTKKQLAEFALVILELLPQYWPEEGFKDR